MTVVDAPERPPRGLSAWWLGAWRHALAVLTAQGTASELRPLLDEYVLALQAAEQAREAKCDKAWDRHARRASGLADLLGLTPRGRR